MATASSHQVSLNDIPYHVCLDNMIKNIDVKTHCYLLMINKQFFEMFDTNEMWKRQFVKTTRLKILDTSIHIGPCGGYDVNKVPLSYWKCDTTIHQKGDTSYKCCCGKGFQHQIVSIFNSNNPIIVANRDTNKDKIEEQPEEVQKEYYEDIKKLHIEHNKKNGLSTVNLCQDINHYDISTLGNVGTDVKYKSFKDRVINKYSNKQKKKWKNLENIKFSTNKEIGEIEQKINTLINKKNTLLQEMDNYDRRDDYYYESIQNFNTKMSDFRIKILNAVGDAIRSNIGLDYDDIDMLPRYWKGAYSIKSKKWFYYTEGNPANPTWNRPLNQLQYRFKEWKYHTCIYEMICQKNAPGRAFMCFHKKNAYNFTIPPSWGVGDKIIIEINTKENSCEIKNHSLITQIAREKAAAIAKAAIQLENNDVPRVPWDACGRPPGIGRKYINR